MDDEMKQWLTDSVADTLNGMQAADWQQILLAMLAIVGVMLASAAASVAWAYWRDRREAQ